MLPILLVILASLGVGWMLIVNPLYVIGGLLLATAGVWLVLGSGWLRRRPRVLEGLRSYPPEETHRALRTLIEDFDPNTSRVARSLLRDLGLPTELTPAGTPEGSGAEVSRVIGAQRDQQS